MLITGVCALTTMAKRIVLNVIKVIAGIAVEVGYV
jgi:hypothetical protein